jgi:hypothetical protein
MGVREKGRRGDNTTAGVRAGEYNGRWLIAVLLLSWVDLVVPGLIATVLVWRFTTSIRLPDRRALLAGMPPAATFGVAVTFSARTLETRTSGCTAIGHR